MKRRPARTRASRANPIGIDDALLFVLVTVVLPPLIAAITESTRGALSKFRALPPAEQDAYVQQLLRSRALWVTPTAALAARQIAGKPTEVRALSELIAKHGDAAVATGGQAATVAASVAARGPVYRTAAAGAASAARANPYHTYRGVSYYTRAGVSRVSGLRGVSFRSVRAVKAAIDEILDGA